MNRESCWRLMNYMSSPGIDEVKQATDLPISEWRRSLGSAQTRSGFEEAHKHRSFCGNKCYEKHGNYRRN